MYSAYKQAVQQNTWQAAQQNKKKKGSLPAWPIKLGLAAGVVAFHWLALHNLNYWLHLSQHAPEKALVVVRLLTDVIPDTAAVAAQTSQLQAARPSSAKPLDNNSAAKKSMDEATPAPLAASHKPSTQPIQAPSPASLNSASAGFSEPARSVAAGSSTSNPPAPTESVPTSNADAPGHAGPTLGVVCEQGEIPLYPPLALRTEQQGRVVLSVTINPQGQPKDPQIKNSSGYALLDQAALKSLQNGNWHFSPALKNGVPIPAQVLIPFAFYFDDELRVTQNHTAGSARCKRWIKVGAS